MFFRSGFRSSLNDHIVDAEGSQQSRIGVAGELNPDRLTAELRQVEVSLRVVAGDGCIEVAESRQGFGDAAKVVSDFNPHKITNRRARSFVGGDIEPEGQTRRDASRDRYALSDPTRDLISGTEIDVPRATMWNATAR